MKINALYFTAPRRVDVRPEILPARAPDQIEMTTVCSAISAGSEMLIYRGEFPKGMATDPEIAALDGQLAYPLKYGYATVARGWGDQLAFAFQPHQTGFVAHPDQLHRVPAGVTAEQAVFLPNMETAVNLVMDGRPMIGERVAVLGQGVVGLLTTALLAQHPLAQLLTVDQHPNRGGASLKMGAHQTCSPDSATLRELTQQFDLVYELSGNPAALDLAIGLTGFGGRIVVGSWYGAKRAPIDLGGAFHRNRIQIISSQVSTLAPALTARWDKARRFELVWDAIRTVQPERLITHRIAFAQAADAYRMLDEQPESVIQLILTY